MAATGKYTTLPAPVRGLNDRDSIVGMKPDEAVILENWWTLPTYIRSRQGSTTWTSGIPSPVKSLIEYSPVSGNTKKFAFAGANVYDVTSSGAVGTAVLTGLNESIVQEASITTPGGSFLVFVNGVDKMHAYNGSTWSIPNIQSVDSAEFVHVTLFKNRLFFARKNSLEVWYLPVNSYAGNASLLDLGSVFRRGGQIMAIYNLTLDAGDGVDDYFVAITTNGEIAIYHGSDPGDATQWAIRGTFYFGAPLGRRCGRKYGGDLILNTLEGVFPMSQSLLSATINRQSALTDKIQNTVSEAGQAYANNFGWQVTVHPDTNMIILNVPKGNGMNYQFVQNTITGAWTKFTGWNANVWLSSKDGLWFGDDNSIKKAYVTEADDGVPISCDVLTSFQYFGDMGANKYFTLIKPYMMSNGAPAVLYGLNGDFIQEDPTGVLYYTAPGGMQWGSMYWGSMYWGGAVSSITGGWHTVGKVANTAALRLKVQNNGAEVRLMNWSVLNQRGNILNYT